MRAAAANPTMGRSSMDFHSVADRSGRRYGCRQDDGDITAAAIGGRGSLARGGGMYARGGLASRRSEPCLPRASVPRTRMRRGAALYCAAVKGITRVLVVVGVCGPPAVRAGRLIHRDSTAAEDTGGPTAAYSARPSHARRRRRMAQRRSARLPIASRTPYPRGAVVGHRPECLRALPILESWHQAYARYGVRIVGVTSRTSPFAADSSFDQTGHQDGAEFSDRLDPAYCHPPTPRRTVGWTASRPRGSPPARIVSATYGPRAASRHRGDACGRS